MPRSQEPERTAEAVRRALPELAALDRGPICSSSLGATVRSDRSSKIDQVSTAIREELRIRSTKDRICLVGRDARHDERLAQQDP